MKKGNSKNRHFSKGTNSLGYRKRLTNRKDCRSCAIKSTKAQLTEKDFKWSRLGTYIQLADFLIDKVPRLFKWLLYFFESVSF